MVLGSGLVDLLRFGDGVSEGGLAGWGKDGLRLLGIAGPAGKGFQILKSAKHTNIAKLIVDIGGPRVFMGCIYEGCCTSRPKSKWV